MVQTTDKEWITNLKATVVQAALRGDQPIEAVAAQYRVSPELVEQWKRQYARDSAIAGFQADRAVREAQAWPGLPDEATAAAALEEDPEAPFRIAPVTPDDRPSSYGLLPEFRPERE